MSAIPQAREWKPRYHVWMTAMRLATLATLLVAGLAGAARADTFGGFSGVDRPYLVNQDKVCAPLAVNGGEAAGLPSCEKATADVVARLSIKPPIVQRGPKASFAAIAAGRTLTVMRSTGATAVTWTAPDPIGKLVEVYASQYDDRVAVAYTVRRMGREVTDVVAFDLGTAARPTPSADPSPPTATQVPPSDPRLAKAVTAARKASRAKALQAWQAVLATDPQHAEARYRIATVHAAARKPEVALATLTELAGSSRADAIEWLVEARFDRAFAGLRADPRFRSTVGLDRAPTSTYERLMGFGGQWEQTGTSCDTPEVRFTVTRDRVVRILVSSRCAGQTYRLPFKGTWRLDGNAVVLTLPTKGKQVTAADEARCQFETAGDEDALRCSLGRDIEFVVLPARR